jgi:hypothetical protein
MPVFAQDMAALVFPEAGEALGHVLSGDVGRAARHIDGRRDVIGAIVSANMYNLKVHVGG